MTLYSKQHPDLPTETCKVCSDRIAPRCSLCNGSGRVSPYSPMIGDEVEYDDYGLCRITTVRKKCKVMLLVLGPSRKTIWWAPCEDLTLIKPCLDTPERQALQEKLEK